MTLISNPELGPFLYAPVVVVDDLPLTVLSALTRQNIDPWEEASRLAALPPDQAACALAAILHRFFPSSAATADTTATRLIQLLPSLPVQQQPTVFPAHDVSIVWLMYGLVLFTMAISTHEKTSPNDQVLQPAGTAFENVLKITPAGPRGDH